MKQILQDLRGGKTLIEDVPAPHARPQHLQIATSVSVISAGTERTLVDFARGSLISKALQQPERVLDAIQKVRTDGLASTYEAVRSKLDQPTAVGYCNVGRVLEVGAGVQGFKAGDRVVSNGKHAEIVVVPWTLCARIPDGVDDENAAFAILGAIALQGMRLAGPTLGEAFVVTGLGLVGLLAVQMLRANGCRVLGIDTDPARLELARQFGAETVDLSKGEDPLLKAAAFSRGRGVDGVLLALSAKSSEPLSQAAKMCRKRGRIVLIGVTGLEMNRADFYEKEISFQVSCSYGPGRYDTDYEEAGRDYPVGYVRWTEQRNFEAVLDMMASGQVDARPLITHRFTVEEAAKGYDVLSSSTERSLGILVTYPTRDAASLTAQRVTLRARPASVGKGVAGFIGAGNYGGRILIKAFADAGAELHTIASMSGVSAVHQGRKSDFRFVTSDAHSVLQDAAVDMVCVATRHDSHARYVIECLRNGKHVFVEKPLCLTLDELAAIEAELAGSSALLMVGFNRRFAPMVTTMKSLLATASAPKAFVMTVNAGAIPKEHWTQDPAVGGGRIVGEACHFIDLLRHLAGSPIRDFDVTAMPAGGASARSDVASITLRFEDGSFGVVNYLANGHKGYPKERLEAFCAGRVLVLDNYRSLKGYGWPSFSSQTSWSQDKGQAACAAAFVAAVKSGGMAPIPAEEILEVSRVSIEAAERAH
ncbi:MAG TPA: bi-domain-containing oxidoreductase [Rhizomicrobium sp.]|nr:bi-domain-containing oxidoreductase [Rhizomicrobium sp.]